MHMNLHNVATIVRTQENRGFVFSNHLCLVCELSPDNQIRKVLRTGMRSEVKHLMHNAITVMLSKPLGDFSPGNWIITKVGVKAGKVEAIFQRRTRIVIVWINPPKPADAVHLQDIELVDIESCCKPFYVSRQFLRAKEHYTLERYLELIDPSWIVSDTHPHYHR